MVMRYFTLILTALFMGAVSAYAQTADSTSAGAAELRLLELIFTGNFGLTIGLIITALGIFTLIKGNTGGAIFLVILGVLITVLPGVYNGVRKMACPIASALGGECGGHTG